MKLKRYLQANGVKGTWFAKRVGTTPLTIYNLANRGMEPKLTLAIAIEDATEGKVSCRDLLPKRERKAGKEVQLAAQCSACTESEE